MDDDALVLLFHGLLPHGGTEFAHGLQDQFGNLPPAAAAELANVLARVGIVVYIKDSVFRAKARPLFEGAGPGYGIYTPAPEVAQHQTSSTFLDAPLARLSFGGSEAHLNYLMRHHALARCFADVELARRYGTPMPVSLTAYLPLQTDFVDPDTGTTFRLTPPRIDPILEPERVRRIAARSEGLDWPLDVIYFSTDRLQRQLQSLTHRALVRDLASILCGDR
jgi:hypothetical protein